tara:strand:+ start:801 stop:1052 length:252 start_codon:yes stop_codon:yes gene_type:complete
MVYSQTKRTASIASITNKNQGGGSKKAGFPYLVGRDSWTSIALHGTKQYMDATNGGLQFTLNPNVRQSRPVGMTPSAGRSYFN